MLSDRNVGTWVRSVAVVAIMIWAIILLIVGLFDRAHILAALGHATLAVSIVSVLVFATFRWLWRLPPIKWILDIPDFSGRWEGWYFRTLSDDALPMAEEIRQRMWFVTANAWGPNNRIQVITASVVTDAHGGQPTLVWTYHAENITASSEAPPRGGDRHMGTHSHALTRKAGGDFLEGGYFNDRVRDDDRTIGAGGYVKLRRVGQVYKDCLAYDKKATWGMQCPDEWKTQND